MTTPRKKCVVSLVAVFQDFFAPLSLLNAVRFDAFSWRVCYDVHQLRGAGFHPTPSATVKAVTMALGA